MMKNFYVYDATGRIKVIGTMTEAMAKAQGGAGDSVGFGIADPGRHYVVEDTLQERPAPPGPHHIFDFTRKQWVDPRTAETEWPNVKIARDSLLSQSDWVVTKALERGEATPAAWVSYRQALRDITLQPDPFSINWPVAPQ